MYSSYPVASTLSEARAPGSHAQVRVFLSRWPIVLEVRVGLGHHRESATVAGPCFVERLAQPSNIGGFSFAMLCIHFLRATQVVIAADDVERHEHHSVH